MWNKGSQINASTSPTPIYFLRIFLTIVRLFKNFRDIAGGCRFIVKSNSMVRKYKFSIPLLFIWVGAFFFWGISFGEDRFSHQTEEKYKLRNIITAIFIISSLLILIFTKVGLLHFWELPI
jgi:hypothetical protein